MATGTAIALGVAGVVSGIAAAAASRKNTADVNEANERMMREQMSYQTSEREAAQEYNTPENQRLRYEQAGFNPYMVMGNIDAGNTAAQTGVSQPVMQRDTSLQDLFSSLGSTAMSSLSAVQDTNMKEKQIEQLGMDNSIKGITLQNESIRQMWELEQKKSDILSSKLSQDEKARQIKALDLNISSLENNLKYLDDMNKAKTSEEQGRAKLVHAQANGQLIQNEIQSRVQAFLPKLQDAQLKNIAAQTYNTYQSAILSQKQGNLTDAQKTTEAHKAIGQAISNELERGNIKIQQLGMNEKEVQSLRNGKMLDRQNNSAWFRNFDAFSTWLTGIPLQFFKK